MSIGVSYPSVHLGSDKLYQFNLIRTRLRAHTWKLILFGVNLRKRVSYHGQLLPTPSTKDVGTTDGLTFKFFKCMLKMELDARYDTSPATEMR